MQNMIGGVAIRREALQKAFMLADIKILAEDQRLAAGMFARIAMSVECSDGEIEAVAFFDDNDQQI
ncbi:MAG TPA: hypothetical protein VGG19_04170 [Tepidisphaeraceae bacterium]